MFRLLRKHLSGRDNYIFHASTSLLKRKPALAPSLIRLYGTYLFTRQSPLRLLDIAITRKCQYRCPHCYPESFYGGEKRELSVAEIIGAVKQGQDLGVVQFNFQGGEPTSDMHRLGSILSAIDPQRHYISISSNGLRHAPEELRVLLEMGVDKIALSLHSGIPEEHDAFVGHGGAYARVMRCLENAKATGLEATLAATVTRSSVRSWGFREVVRLCIDLQIILDINVAMPSGRWSGVTEVLLRPEDYQWLDDLNRNHPNIRRDLHPHLFRRGCPAGKELLYISLYGDVLACPFLHVSPGNIRQQRLGDLREEIIGNPWFASHQPRCLACEDDNFFNHHMARLFTATNLPAPWEEIFGNQPLD